MVAIRTETWLGQSTYPDQMGHFFSGSCGSPGQIVGNKTIRIIFKNGNREIRMRVRAFINNRLTVVDIFSVVCFLKECLLVIMCYIEERTLKVVRYGSSSCCLY